MIPSTKTKINIKLLKMLRQLDDNNETPKMKTLVINKVENKTDKIYDLHKYVQSLATEVEATKLFMK